MASILPELSPQGRHIYSLLIILRDAFNAALEWQVNQDIAAIKPNWRELPSEVPPGTLSYDILFAEPHEFSSPPKLPAGTSPELRAAILALNMCDFGVFATMDAARQMLSGTGVEIEWISVKMQPRFLLETGVQTMLPPHSIILITDLDTQQYIADFTVQQMGHSEEKWFCKVEDYVGICTPGPFEYWKPREDMIKEVEAASEVYGGGYIAKVKREIDVVSAEHDWQLWRQMGEEDRKHVRDNIFWQVNAAFKAYGEEICAEEREERELDNAPEGVGEHSGCNVHFSCDCII
jgi:hypothetical protein